MEKLPPLSSGEIDKYEYFEEQEILPSYQERLIEKAKLTFPPFAKALEKQAKTIEHPIKMITKIIINKYFKN